MSEKSKSRQKPTANKTRTPTVEDLQEPLAPGADVPDLKYADAPKRRPLPLQGQAYFTIAQLSARLQISQRQIAREIERGELVSTYFGRSVRVALHDVLAYEAARRNKKK